MSALFVRNESGRGHQPTARGAALLRIWDALGIAVIIGFAVLLMQPGDPAWWVYLLIVPFAIGPLLMMMFLTGRGPIGALLHYVRRDRAKDSK
jgi:hypothetical protein